MISSGCEYKLSVDTDPDHVESSDISILKVFILWMCSDYGKGFVEDMRKKQCCGSGSGSRRAKMAQKNRKELIKLIIRSAGCSLLRAGGLSCGSDVLYGGLGISKLQFLMKKR